MASMTTCRACTGNRMIMFVLDAYACLDCGLVQVPSAVRPAGSFRRQACIAPAAGTMHDHFSGLADVIRERLRPSPEELVLDIGSSDGLLLGSIQARGMRGLGIEPAANLANIARRKGLEVVNESFTPRTAVQVRNRYGAARVIVTTNRFDAVNDLHDFIGGITTVLSQMGALIVEVPHTRDLINERVLDTRYPERLSEFSLKSLVELFAFFDMEVVDVTRVPIHGRSMRVFATRTGVADVSPTVAEWLDAERRAGLFDPSTYAAAS